MTTDPTESPKALNPPPMTRRDALRASATLAAGLGGASLLPASTAQARSTPGTGPARVLRLAHLTDVHVQPERQAGLGFATALRHMQEQPDPPQLVLFGGDNLMNVDSADGASKAGIQLDVWQNALKNELGLPFITAIGNHDILNMRAGEGTRWAVDAFEIPGRYYTTDRAGWRFIVLDSTSPQDDGYKGRLDDQQFEWLTGTLQNTPETMPVLILSHIPILAACAYFDGENERSGDWVVPGSWMHTDARRLKDLFLKHPRVRLCLSGHIHLIDQVKYNDVWYCCNGAVSGAWWGGANQECQTGYGIVDLYDDGSIRAHYVTYPWTPQD